MKLFLLFTLLFSLNTFADTTITRAFGSSNAQCQMKGDMGKRAYNLSVDSEKLTDTNREISLRVTFLKCAEVDGKLTLVESSAKETLHSLVLLPDGDIAYTNNTLLRADFGATDKFDRILGKSTLDLNAETAVISFSFDKNLDRAFIRAGLKSRVEFPSGEVLNDVFEYTGGFALGFSKAE